jgi:hypothetical protein
VRCGLGTQTFVRCAMSEAKVREMQTALKQAPEKNCRDCCSKCPLKLSRDIELKRK